MVLLRSSIIDMSDLRANSHTLEPPPGQKAEWREIDEDVEAVMDESSSEEENDSKHEEHLFNVALGQYNDMIAKDPTNSTLIARRDALVKNRQQEIDSRNNAES